MFKKKKEKPVEETVSETVKEIMDEEKKPKKDVGAFFGKHRFVVVMAVVMVACMALGTILSSSNSGYLKELEYYIVQFRNETARMNASLEDERTEIMMPDYGLDSTRVNADIEWMKEWITPAFVWNDANEYNEKRSIYVERLGENHPFVRDFMPPHEAQISQDMSGQVTVGTELKGYLSGDNIKTYLTGIDETTGTYSYVMILYQTATDGSGSSRTSEKPVIMTYDIAVGEDGTKHVQNLIAVAGI